MSIIVGNARISNVLSVFFNRNSGNEVARGGGPDSLPRAIILKIEIRSGVKQND